MNWSHVLKAIVFSAILFTKLDSNARAEHVEAISERETVDYILSKIKENIVLRVHNFSYRIAEIEIKYDKPYLSFRETIENYLNDSDPEPVSESLVWYVNLRRADHYFRAGSDSDLDLSCSGKCIHFAIRYSDGESVEKDTYWTGKVPRGVIQIDNALDLNRIIKALNHLQDLNYKKSTEPFD